jgi:hypothetical protein
MMLQTGLIWFRMGSFVGSCEHCEEILGFPNGEKFLDQLNEY